MRCADRIALQLGLTGWGPGWSWFSLNSRQKGTGDRLNIAAPLNIGGNRARMGLNVTADGSRSAVYTYTLSAAPGDRRHDQRPGEGEGERRPYDVRWF
jgi:hypothetical protein